MRTSKAGTTQNSYAREPSDHEFQYLQHDALAPRDIRRYPSELDRVPSRGVAQSPEADCEPTFSEVAASVAVGRSANVANATPSEAPTVKNGAPFSLWKKEGLVSEIYRYRQSAP